MRPSQANSFSLYSHILENTQSAKYLGISIINNMVWGQHISEISSKPLFKTLGWLHRNFTFAPTTLVLRKLHTKRWFGLNWSLQHRFGTLTLKLRLAKLRKFRGRQPAGPA